MVVFLHNAKGRERGDAIKPYLSVIGIRKPVDAKWHPAQIN